MIVVPAALTPDEAASFVDASRADSAAALYTRVLEARLSAALGRAVQLRPNPVAYARSGWSCAPELDALWFACRLGARRVQAIDLKRRVPQQLGLRSLLESVLEELGAPPVALAWTIECDGARAGLTLGVGAVMPGGTGHA